MSQLMIKHGPLHNFPWNVYVDGCGTLTGRNGKNSPTARRGWGPGAAAATARLGRRWAVLPRQETGAPVSVAQPQASEVWGAGLVASSLSRVWESYHHGEQENTASLCVLYNWFTCRHGSVQSKCKPHASMSLYMCLKAHSMLIKGLSLQGKLISARQKSIRIDESFFYGIRHVRHYTGL